MRCPKCQYISFGTAERCRNCGYDFSLSAEAETLDLPIQTGRERMGPLSDLPLGTSFSNPHPPVGSDPSADFEPDRPSRTAGRPDLPLFDDEPLVTPPAVPRLPLSVRRAPPVISRPHQPPSPADDVSPGRNQPGHSDGTGASDSADAAAHDDNAGAAPPVGRMLAGVFDGTLMAGIDLAVVYLTLRLSDLGVEDALLLPALPLLAFFVLLNGGYLVLFTAAGGQTIGKMATRIRVVPSAPEAGVRVPFGAAVLRAAGYLVSLAPAGLGFLPILFSADGRAVHDRLANTRVVRA